MIKGKLFIDDKYIIYLFALGFYPVTPGSNQYALRSPLVKKATLHLENRNTLVIATKNQYKENVYVKNLSINGKELKRNYILHKELMNGGEFVFTMSKKTKK
ncbi:MAG: glycoside hydrolase family 92 protein [Flavobacteriaceae bacterium]|nr:glycoside hydrolase family 92 protein [Flavobacteriaceae bacterium]